MPCSFRNEGLTRMSQQGSWTCKRSATTRICEQARSHSESVDAPDCRSGHCTGMCRCREAHGKDCSRQSFCISSIAQGSAGAAKHMDVRERPSLEVRCARATLAANLPERKAKRRIRGQARSYRILSKPRIAGATLAASLPERSTRRVREQARSYRNLSKPRCDSHPCPLAKCL